MLPATWPWKRGQGHEADLGRGMTTAAQIRDRALELMASPGEPWYVAVRHAEAELTAGAPSWLVGSGGAANWAWFADFASGGTAVDIRAGAGDTAAAFLNYFPDVVLIESDPTWFRFLERRFLEGSGPRPRLLAGDVERLKDLRESAAFISIALAEAQPSNSTRHTLAACRDALTAGGGLRVAPDWDALTDSPHQLVIARANSLLRWIHCLRTLGFKRIRGFYVDPSHHDPRLIIPMTRRATRAVEDQNLRGSASSVLRRTLAWAGVHWPLYRQCFFLATR